MSDEKTPASQLKQCAITCSVHTRPVVSLRFSNISEYGYFLVTASKDGQSQLLNGDTGDWFGTFKGHKGAVWSAVPNTDATRVATGAADFTAKLWDGTNGAELHSFEHQHIVKCVHFDTGCCRLLTGSNERLLRVFDLENYEAAPQQLPGHTKSLKAAIFIDNNRVASLGEDKKFLVRDLRSPQTPIFDKELSTCPTDLELSRNGTRLLLCSGHSVTMWDAEQLIEINNYKLPCNIYSASLHPSEEAMVCGGQDFIMYKCSTSDGSVIESHKGHFGPVHCTRYSPDGRLYASGSEDGTLRLWQHTVGDTYGLWKLELPNEQTA